jgi:hypothetical protein
MGTSEGKVLKRPGPDAGCHAIEWLLPTICNGNHMSISWK